MKTHCNTTDSQCNSISHLLYLIVPDKTKLHGKDQYQGGGIDQIKVGFAIKFSL